MRSSALSPAAWRKSRRSNGGGNGNCVEIAELVDGIGLRDSQDPAGAVLVVPRHEWRVFLGGVRAGHFG